jgi:ATP-binding cassette subfamily C protein
MTVGREGLDGEAALPGPGPLALVGAGAWIVAAGEVNLFTKAAGESAGERAFVGTVPAGNVLFGMPSSDGAGCLTLEAVPVVGARLAPLPRTELGERADDGAAERWARAVDAWVILLSAHLAQHSLRPRKVVPLVAGGRQTVAGDQAALPSEQVLWLAIRSGQARFLGVPAKPPSDPGNRFPLSPETWLIAVGDAEVEPVTTRTLLAEGRLEASLDDWHRFVLDLLARQEEQARRAERERLSTRDDLEKLDLTRAYAHLSELLAPGAAPIAEASSDPLWSACRLVAKASGIDLVAPRGELLEGPPAITVPRLARVCGFRVRQITFHDHWWNEDVGPVLGFLEKSQRPVALLPQSPGHYVLHDPADGSRRSLTPEVASGLSPTGYVFYRPFPARQLAGRDVLRFGLHGTGWDLTWLLGLGALTALLAMVAPYLTGRLYDIILPSADRLQLTEMALALLITAGCTALFQLTESIAIARLEGRTDASLESATWDRLLRLPAPFFRRYTAGDLSDRANAIRQIRKLFSGATLQTFLRGIFSLSSLALLFYYSWQLALVGLGLLLVLVLVTVGLSYLRVRRVRLVVEGQGKLMGFVLQLMTGIAKLRGAGAERRAFIRWATHFADVSNAQYAAGWPQALLTVVTSVFSVLATMTLFACLMLLLGPASALSTGNLLGFLAAFGNLSVGATGTVGVLMSLLEAMPLYDRARPIFETLPETDETRVDPGELTGAVQVSQVTFRYREDTPLVLQDVSLDIRPGEFVALVGPSGSGKSTLLRLLLGFETPGSGTIYYDRQDLAGLDVQAVRRQIGTVLQNGQVLGGSLYSNIVGSHPLTLDDAWEAARTVGLAADIERMPMGMHTVISQGGGTLSGGQRQRLLIARAVILKPRIILFDEATSALDNKTQAIVTESLRLLRATRIVIAHRLSTIVHADRIYVMEAGRIVQHGTYQELLQQEGLFARLARQQLASEAEAG